MAAMSQHYDVKNPRKLNAPLEFGFFGPVSDHFLPLPPVPTESNVRMEAWGKESDSTTYSLSKTKNLIAQIAPMGENITSSVNKNVKTSSAASSQHASTGKEQSAPRWPTLGGGWEGKDECVRRYKERKAARDKIREEKARINRLVDLKLASLFYEDKDDSCPNVFRSSTWKKPELAAMARKNLMILKL
jgi:hypothetical protein